MPEVTINFVAIVIAAVANMVLGFLWYSPMLCGKPWMKLMGLSIEDMKKDKNKANKAYALSSVAALVTSYVLAHFVDYAGAFDAVTGAQVGFWAWLGFIAPVQYTDVLFGGKKINLFFINTGYQLVSAVAMGGILASL